MTGSTIQWVKQIFLTAMEADEVVSWRTRFRILKKKMPSNCCFGMIFDVLKGDKLWTASTIQGFGPPHSKLKEGLRSPLPTDLLIRHSPFLGGIRTSCCPLFRFRGFSLIWRKVIPTEKCSTQFWGTVSKECPTFANCLIPLGKSQSIGSAFGSSQSIIPDDLTDFC